MILRSADGFLFVVDSSRGKILFVSESVRSVLKYTQSELFGHSLFDIVHPKDIAKVKEQICSVDFAPRDRLIDSKTMLPMKVEASECPADEYQQARLSSGSRRSFFCRIKTKSSPVNREGASQNSAAEKKYAVIQCTGYLKSWSLTNSKAAAAGNSGDHQVEGGGGGGSNMTYNPENPDGGGNCISCLVAVGRQLPESDATKSMSFSARLTVEGKYAYVEPKATSVLGFLPQELVGTSLYEHVLPEDRDALCHSHRNALRDKYEVNSREFGFKAKKGEIVRLKGKFLHFRNPWTKEIEYIVAKFATNPTGSSDELFYLPAAAAKVNNETDPTTIGRKIAEEIQLRNNSPRKDSGDSLNSVKRAAQLNPANANNSDNDMSVIMSLLEADAGLTSSTSELGVFPWS